MLRPTSSYSEMNEPEAMPCFTLFPMATDATPVSNILNDSFDTSIIGAHPLAVSETGAGARLHPWQLSQLDVDLDTFSTSTDICDSSFPSSCTTSASVSQFASPLSPSIYTQLCDVNFSNAYPLDAASTMEGSECFQNPLGLGLSWGFPQAHATHPAFLNDFTPNYSLQPHASLDAATASVSPVYSQGVPPRIGRAHSHSLSSLTTSFTNLSTPNSPCPSVTMQAPAVTTTTLLQPTPRRNLRSYSSPSLKASFSPNTVDPPSAQTTALGITGVDELMKIDEGETMELVLPATAIAIKTDPAADHELSDPSTLSQGRFVSKLWRMVHHKPATDAIGWSENGKTLVVPRVGDVTEQLLRLYFRHSNFNSLVRQLAKYGFTKYKVCLIEGVRRAPDSEWRWEFTHPYFQRGRPDLLDLIKRNAGDSAPAVAARTAANRLRAASASDVTTSLPFTSLPVHVQVEEENVRQRAEINLLRIQREAAQNQVRVLQEMFDRERGRADRLAMVAVTLMSVCSDRFPEALSSLPPYEEEDLVMIHSPLREGFQTASYDEDNEDGDEQSPTFPSQPSVAPPSLHIVTSHASLASESQTSDLEMTSAGGYEPSSCTSLQPSSSTGLQTPTFGAFPECSQSQQDDPHASAELAFVVSQNADADAGVSGGGDRQLKRPRVDESATCAPARLRSYSASAVSRLSRSSQTFPRPVRMKRPSQSQIVMQAQQ